MAGPFAFVRNLKTSSGSNIKTFSGIKSAESHAKRQDLTSQGRQVEGRRAADNYFWSKAGDGLEGGGADYVAAYKAHKRDFGVTTERKGAAIAQHLLVGASPEWLAETGDPRDLDNPRVSQLIDEAKAWAQSWMGEGAVWAVRYDIDEKGAGVVDILASPIREQRHKSGSSKPAISIRKTNAELADKHSAFNAWEAMQTDWAIWAKRKMDQKLQRGIPKRDTGRKNVPPEVYAAAVEQGRQEGLSEALRGAERAIEDEIHYRLVEMADKLESDLSAAKRAKEIAMQKADAELRTANYHGIDDYRSAYENAKREQDFSRGILETAKRKAEEQAEIWQKSFELLKSIMKTVLPEQLYETIAGKFRTEWAKMQTEEKPAPKPAPPPSGPSGP